MPDPQVIPELVKVYGPGGAAFLVVIGFVIWALVHQLRGMEKERTADRERREKQDREDRAILIRTLEEKTKSETKMAEALDRLSDNTRDTLGLFVRFLERQK